MNPRFYKSFQHLSLNLSTRVHTVTLPEPPRATALLYSIDFHPCGGSRVLDNSMNRVQAWHGPRTGPGILVLSSTGECEYLNSTACALIRRLHTFPTLYASEHLPSAVMRVAENIQTLAMSDRAKDWERLEIREVAGAQDPVLIRGFGLPSGKEKTRVRVLLLLEAIGRRESAGRRVKERFQLTDREQTIVEGWATGRTNKEIAADLRIREPTVKAHIRNIMGKTRCRTRTAVVALLLQSEETRHGHPAKETDGVSIPSPAGDGPGSVPSRRLSTVEWETARRDGRADP